MSKCEERACPFHAEDGQVLCRQHRLSFSYEISLYDRSIDPRVDFEGDGKTADGLNVVRHSRYSVKSQQEIDSDILIRALASASIVDSLISRLSESGHQQVSEWKTKFWAAVELFEACRWGVEPFCPICGCTDLWNHYDGMRRMRTCKLCRFQFSVMHMSFMTDTHMELNRWVSAIDILHKNPNRGVITQVQRELACGYKTAWRVNHLVRLAAKLRGRKIGYSGMKNLVYFTGAEQRLKDRK